MELRIISGGQTGVDRGALDAALAAGAPCGGWCPAGRLDENGIIPSHYPLSELPRGGYFARTIRNLQEAGGTLILYFGELEGGTAETLVRCLKHHRPFCLVDAAEVETGRIVQKAAGFVRSHRLESLNVAGPRASKHPEAYACAFTVVTNLIAALRAVTDSEPAKVIRPLKEF